MGGIRGGLGLAVIFVCVILAATTGIVGASVVGMALLAGPKLIEKGYNKAALGRPHLFRRHARHPHSAKYHACCLWRPHRPQRNIGRRTFCSRYFPRDCCLAFLYTWLMFLFSVSSNQTMALLSAKKRPQGIPESQKSLDGYEIHGSAADIDILPFWVQFWAGVATPSEAAGVGVLGAAILAIASGNFNWTVVFEAVQVQLSGPPQWS